MYPPYVRRQCVQGAQVEVGSALAHKSEGPKNRKAAAVALSL